MNKELYQRPEMDITEFETVSLIATSLAANETTDEAGITSGNANGRRAWGNLWE